MTITEMIYTEVLKRQIVTFEEFVDIARFFSPSTETLSKKAIYSSYLYPLTKQNKLKKVRRGLYVGIPPGTELPVDKFLIGSKLASPAVLSYHTALEFYGCAENVFDEVYLTARRYFKNVDFLNYHFHCVVNDTSSEVNKLTYKDRFTIYVTSRERTFVDCLDKPKYAGGWEEITNSLLNLGGIDIDKTIRLTLEKYKKQLLLRKVGFFLELFKKQSVFYSTVTEEHLTKLLKGLSTSYMYLQQTIDEKFIANKKWKLYIPQNMKTLVESIY